MIQCNPGDMIRKYVNGQHAELADEFLRIWGQLCTESLDWNRDQFGINSFVKHFLFIFTQPDFRLEDRHVEPFIRMGRVISNIVYLSEQKTTDAHLVLLWNQPNNLVKILTLLSARNYTPFDRNVFFNANAGMASLWYLVYSFIFYPGLQTERSYNNLREHFKFSHPNLRVLSEVQELYFGATYAGTDMDRGPKEVVNLTMRELVAKLPPVRNTPNPKKIAVLSACWFPQHSVYRNYCAYVAALKEKYHLTFFHFAAHQTPPDTSLFDDVHILQGVGGIPPPLQDNDFAAAYFPDIGMSPHSIILANARIAPVQFCSPGHSVSTWGADIDYYFSGADVEVEDNPQQHYSEKLVLLPGMGVIHNKPLYEPKGRKRPLDGEIIVNCPWTCQKINYPFLNVLQRIAKESPRPFKYRMFIGASAHRQNDYLPFMKDVLAMLPNAEIYPGLDYAQYMALMEEGDLTLDSHHFGGCNVISDSLWLRLPTITWEGEKWYNRIGSAMMRKAGLGWFAAKNERDYAMLATALIGESGSRSREEFATADLSPIYDTSDAKYFVRAVDRIIAEPDLKNQPGPLRIERDA